MVYPPQSYLRGAKVKRRKGETGKLKSITVFSSYPFSLSPFSLLLARLSLQPFLKIFLSHDLQIGVHFVMPQPAELGAHNIVLPAVMLQCFLGGGEVNGYFQTGKQVLLDSQLAHVERMVDIFGAQGEFDRAVHGNA